MKSHKEINKKDHPLLTVRGLKTEFRLRDNRVLHAVDGVDLSIRAGEIHGLVGESGCGKTVAALSVLRLIRWPGYISDGQVIWQSEDLLKLKKKEMQKIRGKEISMIFQEPMTSLNPVFTIGTQLADVMRLHDGLSKNQALNKAVELLGIVKIADPHRRIKEYPHQLSGGMRQRVMIAMAISCQPKLIIADEPTTALDVTIQKQILDLMKEIQEKTGTSFILITHDWDVILEIATKVAVMYAGRIIEYFTAKDLYRNPMHPYTRALVQSIPRKHNKENSTKRLKAIAGNVPDLADLPVGCKFSPRCPDVFEQCVEVEPTLKEIAPDHLVRCWKYMN